MTDTNNMAKKTKAKIKVEKVAGKVEFKTKEEIKPENVQIDGIFETEDGYAIFAGNVHECFVGSKNIAFNEAVKKYKIVKSI